MRKIILDASQNLGPVSLIIEKGVDEVAVLSVQVI